MSVFDGFKTSNSAYWRGIRGAPGWWLNWPGNVWDALMDAIAAAVATFVPYEPMDVTIPPTVGASPWTYTAGGSPEIVYISGGSVSSVTRNGVPVTQALPCTILLARGRSVVITYTLAPYVAVDK